MKAIPLSYVLSLVLLLGLFGVLGVTNATINDPEFDSALDWMYTEGLTKYDTQEGYQPENYLTREQAAKFLGTYVRVENIETGIMKTNACVFADDGLIDETLKSAVVDVCERGLMKGWGGSFHPGQYMTKAEVITVLVRISEGELDESQDPRWTLYVETAQQSGMTKETDMSRFEQPVTRYEIALLMWRLVSGNEVLLLPYLDEQDDLLELLKQLGLREE